MQPRVDWPELGRDELDLPPPRSEGRRWLPYRRLALGGRATATPTLIFVAIGAALGPYGLNVLSLAALAEIRALVWVALAIIGVFVGLGLTARRDEAPIAAAGLIAVMTIAVIAAGFYWLSSEAQLPLPGNRIAAAVLIGLCASASAAIHLSSVADRTLQRASRLADLDDVPLLFGGFVALSLLVAPSGPLRAVVTLAAAVLIALAGCLLFARADENERGLFVTGAVLLLAGVAAYLGTSPLVSGCVAAVVWVRVPGVADRITAHDLRLLHHPLVALMIIVASAGSEWTIAVVWASACVVVLRLAAKLVASMLGSRVVSVPPAMLASMLLPPGIIGIALAMNVVLVLGDEYRWLLSTVVAAAVTSEILATFVPAGDEA